MEAPPEYERIHSLRAVRRIGRADFPRAISRPRQEIEALGDAAQKGFVRRRGPPPAWLGDYVEFRRGRLLHREGRISEADAPCLIAFSRTEFAVFCISWPRLTKQNMYWPIALAMGHLDLHFRPDGEPDDEFDEPPPLYVPHFLARTSLFFPARLEAMWWAAGFLMPRSSFAEAWEENHGNPADTAAALSIPGASEMVIARATEMGLA
jgi:hypothetical protein